MKLNKIAIIITTIIMLPGCLENLNDSPADKIAEDSYNGVGLSPTQIEDFILVNQHNQNVSLSDFKGKVVVVAFTFTACPDVCPVIEHNLKLVQDILGESYGKDVAFISITLDPARDTPEKLKSHWHDGFGFEWDHLTHQNGTVVEEVWTKFNIFVDNDYVNFDHSRKYKNSLTMLYPDNSSDFFELDYNENHDGWNLSTSPLDSANISYNYTTYDCCGKYPTEFKNHTAPDDNSWYWELLVWNHSNSTWDSSDVGIDSLDVLETTHIAWIPSNANKSLLNNPTEKECNGHGWIMGSGSSAHCMCDDGYKWDGDNRLTCISKNSNSAGDYDDAEYNESEPYTVGHQTLTLILDQNLRKRIAWTGFNWDETEFAEDVMVLVN